MENNGPTIPDHQLIRLIDRGSYGEVWLAQNKMGTYRAVKIVHRKAFDHSRPYERELAGIRRFEPISRSHEGFVDVLQIGINETEEYFYYVMELGDDENSGRSIDAQKYSPKTLVRKNGQLPQLAVKDCIDLGLALTRALAELHKHGLVHRDIKPSNIIFVDGVPKLADIGLVADVNDARSYVGTEGFIPPEGPGTPQADIYSLGKVLYEASTGKDRQEFPSLPTFLGTQPDTEALLELNEVILQACHIDPASRYQTAWEMHGDLVVLANGKSVRRLKFLERRLSHIKRVAGIAAIVVAVIAAISFQGYREWRLVFEARQRNAGAHVADGRRAMEAGELLTAFPYFAEALFLDQGNPRREMQHRIRLGSVLAQSPKLVQLWVSPGELYYTGFSPDGQHVFALERSGKAQIFDYQPRPGGPLRFGDETKSWRGMYSPDGTRVVIGNSGNDDRKATIWRASDGALLATLKHTNRVMSAAFSPDGTRIVTATLAGGAYVWDAQLPPGTITDKYLFALQGHTQPLRYATYSHNGRLIVTASQDHTACLWNSEDGSKLSPVLEHDNWVMYADFSPDDRQIVTAGWDYNVRVWRTDTGERIWPDMPHQNGVSSAEFSPDGRLIVTASSDYVSLWNAETHLPASVTPAIRHSDYVTHATFHPDGRQVASACADGTVRVWDLAGSASVPSLEDSFFSPEGSRFATLTQNGLEVRDTISRQLVSPPIQIGLEPDYLQLTPEGRFLVVGNDLVLASNDQPPSVRVIDVASGKIVGKPIHNFESMESFVLSKDGTLLAGLGTNNVQIWNVQSGSALATNFSKSLSLQDGVFSPRGDKIATWSGSAVAVWDPKTGRELFPTIEHKPQIRCVEFSPDGASFVTCAGGGRTLARGNAQIWSAATGKAKTPPLGHADGVIIAAFSPDGQHIVTAGEDFMASVWNTLDGKRRFPALRHEEKVCGASFSPNGKWVVTVTVKGHARVWDAETGAPLAPIFDCSMNKTAEMRSPTAKFLADGRHFLIYYRGGPAWILELASDKRPVEDLRNLAFLLSAGDSASALGGPFAPRSESPSTIFQRLRPKYPSDFVASPQEVAAWYESGARHSEIESNWPAAIFHLEHLKALRPDDAGLDERLNSVNDRMKASGNQHPVIE
jgi:WD40 repeat protein